MNPFFSFIIRTAVSLPSSILIWLVSFFGFDQTFSMASIVAIVGGGIVYWLTGSVLKNRFLKKHGLSRKEYQYIKKNLDEAKLKINRLQKALFSIKHIRSLKDRIELLRMTKNIYKLTNKEPSRFYQAEKFYFSHLDSVLELTEKYAFLSSQSKTNRELEYSLRDSQETLEDLTKLVEKDLYVLLSNDIDHLNFEIDVAKNSIKKYKELPDESRRLK
ncbi:5-bromo-4-chloroindolyl phosphate hydrolysis family protein [Mesobacillus sp. S13]|uniref:5-bromo-4-chloroindolyl phosphate hydrolysis family protein n=1 Tax=Mesobacillus sp. S13 TaxID=2880221 RepID=UPI001CF18389|nr:5-bromo-4-chloroindolyl phosphate hydrolysis family protein [Mesobacillus sp. S13]